MCVADSYKNGIRNHDLTVNSHIADLFSFLCVEKKNKSCVAMKIFLNMKLTSFIVLLGLIMGDSGEIMSVNLESWMNDLAPHIKDMPLTDIAIPGSHDSMTYSITRSNGLAPDADTILKRIYPLLPGALERWTITQKLDTMQQLLVGIRYLDLRLATKTGTNLIFFTHALYADEISQPLTQVKDFVDAHPGEVVILDFQHFYGFTADDHARLIRYLVNLYGHRLALRPYDLRNITLNTLARLKHSIIIVYRNHAAHTTTELWFSQMLHTPWPQQDSITGLLGYFRNVTRPAGVGFVHQAVLTPTTRFIILRFPSSIRNKCAKPVLREVLPVLSADFSPGPVRNPNIRPAPVNVVIGDFVDLENNLFPRTIIALNNKLHPPSY